MKTSSIILLSDSGSVSETAPNWAISLINGIRDKASSLILRANEASVPNGYENRNGLLVRSGGLIATATQADIARYSR